MPAKRKSATNIENKTGSPSKKVKPSKTDDENEDTTVLDDSNKPTTSAARLRDLSNKLDTMATKTPKREAKGANKALSVKDREKAFENLVEKLKSAEKSGDYSVEGEANELPTLLGLYVKEFGSVELPLVKRQAEELIKVCKPAPYGKNMDTLIDTNVRDSYQLDPEQIEIRNPEWSIKLKDLVFRVGQALGCQDKIEAKLYKVLIYKPGGHFLKHRDSEKDKKMFGTLIIQPPSIHTGGELVVYEANGKSNKVIDFGQKENKSKFSVQFAAHYADLEHELLEVKSGYRLALVYSLCWIRGNGHLTYYNNSSLANELSSILDKLNDQPYQLGLLMEHQYTAQSFQTNGFRALKGNDNDCYNLLNQANQLLESDKQLTMYICHASLFIERYDVSGYDHPTGYIDPKYKHYKWDESNRDYKIAEWYDINGNAVFNSSHFELLDFFTKMFDMSNRTSCQPVNLKNESEWGKYTRQEIGGYLGNESVTNKTTYNKYVLVVWPKRFEYEILIKIDVNLVVDSVYKSIVINSLVEPIVMEQFQAVLKFVPPPKKPTKKEKGRKGKGKQTKTLNGKAINEILEILLKLNDMKYLEEFFSHHKPLITLINCRLFVKLIVQFGYESIKHLLNLVVNPTLEELIQNCHFIMALHEEKQTRPLALDYMMSCVIPLMKKSSELKKIIDYARHDSFAINDTCSWEEEDKYWRKNLDDEREEDILVEEVKKRHVLVIIAKTLHLFHDHPIVNDAFDALIEAALKPTNDEDEDLLFYDLSTEFHKEKSALKKCTRIKSLFERRKAALEKKLKHKPPFSWSMPKAKIPEHPRVQAFLRGEDEQMTYSAPFRTAQEVRNFINDYNDCYGWGFYTNEFSAKITERPGKNVLIKKTKKVYEDRVTKYELYESEIDQIKSYFQSKPFV